MDQLFEIFKFTEKEAEKVITSPDDPHLHTYEELLIGMEGSLEHFIDFRSEIIDAPYASFVTRGKVHRVIPRLIEGKCSIWVIRFKSEFIPEITFQLYAYYHDHANIPLNEGSCFERMVTLSRMMHEEMQQATPELSIIRHLLSALFIMVESERKKQQPEQILYKTQNVTFRNFLKILEENYRRNEGVEFYAEKLFMTPRNLNLICQNILNKTVTETIELRKLIEAKNLLINTDKTVAEIGFELGYREKAYFTNVFKKKSGQTPTEFRDEMRKLIS